MFSLRIFYLNGSFNGPHFIYLRIARPNEGEAKKTPPSKGGSGVPLFPFSPGPRFLEVFNRILSNEKTILLGGREQGCGILVGPPPLWGEKRTKITKGGRGSLLNRRPKRAPKLVLQKANPPWTFFLWRGEKKGAGEGGWLNPQFTRTGVWV